MVTVDVVWKGVRRFPRKALQLFVARRKLFSNLHASVVGGSCVIARR